MQQEQPQRFQPRRRFVTRRGSPPTPLNKSLELLEPRQMLAGDSGASSVVLVPPTNLDVTITYRNQPDGSTNRAQLTWTDTNLIETGYRVEQSPDGVNNWTVSGPDAPANSSSAYFVLDAGQKLYYRVSAVAGLVMSTPSEVATPMAPVDRVVQVTASASGSTISLKWPLDPDAVSYNVYRKSRLGSTWYLRTATPLDANSTGFTESVAQGSAYEYQVERVTRNFYGTLDGKAYGYVYAGNRYVGSDKRGRALLVVDDTRATAIAEELTQYRRDLLSDGWSVQQITVPRDNGDARLAAVVKAQIQAIAMSQPNDPLRSIVLIGHVPVPYSGITAWDGHPDHAGAWPADSYYGEAIGVDADAGVWTDTKTHINGGHPDNTNLPGDGKFDQDMIPSALTVPVGRIDFANLPGMRYSFNPTAPDADISETMLLKRYFDKNHAWRTRATMVGRTAIQDDHLGGSAAENGWRNFAPLVGAAQTTSADWVTTMGDTSNLWSAGLGSGANEYAIGVVDIFRLHTPNVSIYSVFNLFSGSWFGDWNKHSNLMREIVASNGTTLTSLWTGTPNVFMHTMGLGETIGQAMMLTQNNTFSGPYLPASTGSRGTHVGLMGDPTLTQTIAPPVSNLTSSRTSNINSVSWTTPNDAGVTGFHVYRADGPDGPFYRLNSSPIPTAGSNTTMSFTDPTPIRTMKKFTYMVRTIKMQAVPSGRYENYSWGQTVQSKLVNGEGEDAQNASLTDEFGRPAQPMGSITPIARVAQSIFSDSSIDAKAHPLDALGL